MNDNVLDKSLHQLIEVCTESDYAIYYIQRETSEDRDHTSQEGSV